MGSAHYSIKQSEIIFQGKVFDLQVDEIEYDSGNKGIREVAVHPGGSVILPVTAQYKIVFVNQFRYPHQKWMLELPAGKLNKDENPLECAVRELQEETGYSAGKVEKLGQIATTPGFCTEILHIYAAFDLEAGQHRREEGEHGMEMVELAMKDIDGKILKGEIFDAKTLAGILLFKLKHSSR